MARISLLETLVVGAMVGTLVYTITGVGGCSTGDQAISAAQSAGIKQVRLKDSQYLLNFTCGQGEKAYYISGKNPAGNDISATVCCGHTTPKDCTIRY